MARCATRHQLAAVEFALNITQIVYEELTSTTELAEQTIRYQAQYDDLTNLPNRRLFLTTLRQEMAKAERHHRYGAVIFIDLDRFKSVIDSLGHSVDDDLLIEAAQKTASRLRQEDTVARPGEVIVDNYHRHGTAAESQDRRRGHRKSG